MKSLFSWLFPPKAALSRLDALVLDGVREQLGPSMAGRWAAQIASLTQIERAPGRRLIHLRRTARSSTGSGGDMALPLDGERTRLATLTLSIPGGFAPLRADVHCQDGILSSIEYHDDSEWMEEAVRRNSAQHILVDCALAPAVAELVGRAAPLAHGAA